MPIKFIHRNLEPEIKNRSDVQREQNKVPHLGVPTKPPAGELFVSAPKRGQIIHTTQSKHDTSKHVRAITQTNEIAAIREKARLLEIPGFPSFVPMAKKVWGEKWNPEVNQVNNKRIETGEPDAEK